MAEWVPGLQNIEVLQNTFTYAPAVVNERNADFRRRFGIPENAFLIGRYTRIIPQKRIDRDIHLLAAVNIELAARGTGRSAYLVVAGDTGECPAEHSSLSRLAGSLGVGDRVVFTGQLAPAAVSGGANCGFSVRDLLAHADLASFLTSYDYESYGNPIGEAIASCVPYITTRYKVYDAVYGDKGFQALVLEIAAHKDQWLNSTTGSVGHTLRPAGRRGWFGKSAVPMRRNQPPPAWNGRCRLWARRCG